MLSDWPRHWRDIPPMQTTARAAGNLRGRGGGRGGHPSRQLSAVVQGDAAPGNRAPGLARGSVQITGRVDPPLSFGDFVACNASEAPPPISFAVFPTTELT